MLESYMYILLGIILGVVITFFYVKFVLKKYYMSDEIKNKVKKEIEDEFKVNFAPKSEVDNILKSEILQKEKKQEKLETEINNLVELQNNQKINLEELNENLKVLQETFNNFKSKESNIAFKKEDEGEPSEHKVMNFTTYKSNTKENATKVDDNAWIKDKIINSKIEHLVMLVVRKGNNFGSKINLPKDVNTTIGKDDNNVVVINENKVSSSHAVIKNNENGHLICDLHSKIGTYVNEELIEQPKLLKNGDVIRIGDTEFIFCKII